MPSDYQNFLYPAGGSAGSGGSGSGGANTRPPTLRIGTVQTLEPNQSATATITGSGSDYTLNLGLPKGAMGATGAKGDRGETGAAGSGGADSSKLKPADLYKEYQAGYMTRPDGMANNTWAEVRFPQPFTEPPMVFCQPVLDSGRLFSIGEITATSFKIQCNYVGSLVGFYYEAYVPKP